MLAQWRLHQHMQHTTTHTGKAMATIIKTILETIIVCHMELLSPDEGAAVVTVA